MNQYFTEKKPDAFTLNRRLHHVGSWMDLVHELLEDLFMSADPDGTVIAGTIIPETDKPIVCGKEYAGKAIPLSNGLRIPAGYDEREYALACRAICVAYGITPCEMSIAYAETEETEPDMETPQPEAGQISPSEEPEPEKKTETDSVSDVPVKETVSALTQQPVFNNLPVRKKGHEFLNDSEEMWLKLMLNKQEDEKPSDHIRMTRYNEKHEEITENPDWDTIIAELQNDKQAAAAAKMLKKAGIRPPVPNFRGIKEQNKVGGEALFVWMDEGAAYLHGRQKYSKGYFLERGFKHVIVDSPRELVECFREMEADNE
ncbi:MAG: hypothetical protein IKP86_11030 [Anaerolineaceae bacterium]|nr:hypothetical protein [Anaerolineaceae bacterium]